MSFNFNDDIRPLSFPPSLPAKELYILIKTHYGLDQENIFIVFNRNGSKSVLPRNSSAAAYFWGIRPLVPVIIQTIDDFSKTKLQMFQTQIAMIK